MISRPRCRVTALTLDLGAVSVEVSRIDPPRLLKADFNALIDDIRQLISQSKVLLLPCVIDRFGAPRREPRFSWGESLVESVRECAAVSMAELTDTDQPDKMYSYAALTGVSPYPVLLGSKEAIRLICSYAERIPEPGAIHESRPLRTHYQNFSKLWTVSEDEKIDDLIRKIEQSGWLGIVFQIGKLMGRLHSESILHGDAHLGNFPITDEGQVVINDPRGPVLYCPPTPAQAANDLMPLLGDFKPVDWQTFKLAYSYQWPAGARRVIDFIELGDSVGWGEAIALRNFQRAIQLLNVALEELDSEESVPRIMLLANRAQVYSHLDQHAEARADCDTVAALARQYKPAAMPLLTYFQAFVLARGGDRAGAISMLQGLIDSHQTDATLSRLAGELHEALIKDGKRLPELMSHSLSLRL
jgi:hypothetical protein